MPTQQTVPHRHRLRTRFATGLVALSAFTASVAPSASADPQPLAKAEATIAANQSTASTPVLPNPDQQAETRASTSPDDSGARLPHDPLPRTSASSATQTTSLSEIQQGAKEAGLHPGVFSPSEAPSIPATVVRTTAADGDFHWGDAGIGAGGMLAVTLIGVGGLLTVTARRNHRVRDEHAG